METSADHQWAFAGVTGQLEALSRGQVTAVQLLGMCLNRIARYDGELNAFRTLFPDAARREAQAADTAREQGTAGPLAGLPIAVKDNVPIAGHAPSYGTASPEPSSAHDAELVRRLRAAGAVIIGTTHLPELALWPFTESARWGATRNPWDTARSAGGSSGGSAAAVAAGLVPVATASDGGGSIRIPAAACGLVGLKPQRGRVPLGLTAADQLEHWYGLSCAGVVTRTVADTATVLSVLTDGAVGAPAPPASLRIRWTDRAPVPAKVSRAQRSALESTLSTLAGLGHDVARADPSYGRAQLSFLVRYGRGAAQDLAALADPASTEPRTRAVAAIGRRLSDDLLRRARTWGDQAAASLSVLPDDADVLVMPVLVDPPAPVGELRGMRALGGAARVAPFAPTWNVTGQPALSMPVGLSPAGLPLAVQLISRPGQEAILLSLAAQLEAATGASGIPPRFRA